jgi:negative regulator of genetic competence, sporulation and motility
VLFQFKEKLHFKVRFEVLTAASMKIIAIIALLMEAANTSETSVNF